MNRKNAVEGVKNALWALGFAVGIWFLVDQNIRRTLNDVPAQLFVEPPPGVTVTYLTSDGKPPEATVKLSAPTNVLEKRPEWRLHGVYNMKQATVELNKELQLRTSEFEYNLPPEVDLLKEEIQPQSIRVVFAKQERVEVAVHLDYTNVPDGWEVAEYETIPASVEVSGPKEKVDALAELRSEKIDVARQLKFRRWEPTQQRPVAVDSPLHVIMAPGLSCDAAVQMHMIVRPKMREMPVEMVPELALAVPLPGLTIGGRCYKLEPRPGGERVSITLVGPENELAELKNPKTLAERVRAFAIITPDLRKELPNKVEKLVSLPVEVKLPEGIQRVDKELRIDVNVSLAEPASTAAPTGTGENR
jgi:hypothetical protein